MKKIIAVTAALLLLSACSAESIVTESNMLTSVSESTTVTEYTSESEDISETSVTTEPIVSDTVDLSEFVYTLEQGDYSSHSYCDLDSEIIELIEQASDIFYGYYLNLNESTFENKGTVSITVTNEVWNTSYDENFIRTGIDFDSFCDYLRQFFTDEYVDDLISNSKLYQNYMGELCFIPIGAYIPNDCFQSIEFAVSESSEESIKLCGTAKYADTDNSNEVWENTYSFEIIKTEKGWRFNNFEDWK